MSAPTTHTGVLDVDQMAADAQKRLASFIARTAAQHQRRMRETWATAPHAPLAVQVASTQATPWLDDITPMEPDLSDLDDDDLWLADVALAVLVGALLIVSAGFVAGYTFARMG